MNSKVYQVLFLCTANSARSILAEALLNHLGQERFKAYSAGSFPSGKVNAVAIDLLNAKRISTHGLRSKTWNEFATRASSPLDFIITVCDNAANEVCPIWPGQPIAAHWGVPDPAAVTGDEETKRRAFLDAFMLLKKRIDKLVALPLEQLSHEDAKTQLKAIGGLL